MAYYLRAVIGGEVVLRELADTVAAARIVPLGQHLSLVPVTTAFAGAVTGVGAPALAGFLSVPAGVGDVLARCSATGPVACVEAEYFAGTGTQTAQVWQNGTVVLGPLHQAEDDPLPRAGSPISQALRRLGAARGHHADEFEAIGLDRRRRTEAWLPRATGPAAGLTPPDRRSG